MKESKIKEEINYYMNLAQGRIILLNNWWGMRYSPDQIITILKEIESYLKQVIKLEEEKNENIESHGTAESKPDTSTSGQSEEGAWGPVGAYTVNQRKRDFAGNNSNS